MLGGGGQGMGCCLCQVSCGLVEEAKGGCLTRLRGVRSLHAVGGVGGVVYEQDGGPGPYQGAAGVAVGSDPAELWGHVGAAAPRSAPAPGHGSAAPGCHPRPAVPSHGESILGCPGGLRMPSAGNFGPGGGDPLNASLWVVRWVTLRFKL